MNLILSVKVHMVVEHEWEVLRALREGTSVAWNTLVQQDSRLAPLRLTDCEAPGLPAAYRELTSASQISPDLTFRLYDTHGIHPDLIQELFEALGKHNNSFIQFCSKFKGNGAKDKSQSIISSKKENKPRQ